MKTARFHSEYLPDFTVVEERQGNSRLYPATQQLPRLLRALIQEFEAFLSRKIVRADERADDFLKIQRRTAVNLFCHWVNDSRADDLHLFALVDHDRVAHVAIVQHIITDTPQGGRHHFKFYAGEDFFTEIFLSGRRLVFTDHALERFLQRASGGLSNDMQNFLLSVFDGPHVALNCGSDSLVLPFSNSIIALPFRNTDEGLFIPTCLGMDEIYSMEVGMPTYALNLHYGRTFVTPAVRNWNPTASARDLLKRWERKEPMPNNHTKLRAEKWSNVACKIKDLVEGAGHGPGSRFVFLDHIPGPSIFEIKPGELEQRHDEIEYYKKVSPGHDWEAIVAERDRQINMISESEIQLPP
jgi:hypothetical protein